MKRVHITLSGTAIALVAALGATTPALAAVCENVTFSFKNGLSSERTINVVKVRYRDTDSSDPGKEWVENVHNTECPTYHDYGTCRTNGDDLGSITRPRENHELTDIQFYYHEADPSGGWQHPKWSSDYKPFIRRCTDDRDYGPYTLS